MHGHHPETHNYRPACARTGLAAPRRPSLVIQKIYRLGVGVANNWLGRPFWRGLPAMVERVEQAIKLAGSLTSNGPGSTGMSSPDASAPAKPNTGPASPISY
jgi:hypothetical protein